MYFRYTITIWLPNSSELSEIRTLLFGFHTPQVPETRTNNILDFRHLLFFPLDFLRADVAIPEKRENKFVFK